MKFGLVATLLVATFVASSAGDFTETFKGILQTPAVQQIFAEGLVKILEKVDFNGEDNYEAQGVLFPGIEDPLTVDDDSVFMPPALNSFLIGNLTSCSSTKIAGLSSFHNYTRAILLPFPVKLQAEVRFNEFNIHGFHFVDLSVLGGDAPFDITSLGEFHIDLSRAFAGLELHVYPNLLNFSAPINVTGFIINLGVDSLTINAADTRLSGVPGADPVDWTSVNRDIALFLESGLLSNITTTVQDLLLTLLIKPTLAKCSIADFIAGEFDCLLSTTDITTEDERPLLETIFGFDEALDGICKAGPELPEIPQVTPETTSLEPETGTGSTTTEPETGTGSTTENLAADLKPALSSSIILAAIAFSRYFF